MENLLEKITAEQINSVKTYGVGPERKELPRDQPIEFKITKFAEPFEDTVIYENYELGQELTVKNLFSMLDAEATKAELLEQGEYTLLPFGKGSIVKPIIVEQKKFPKSMKIEDMVVTAGATEDYLNDQDKGEIRREAYAHHKIPTEGEHFPLLVVKNRRKNSQDMENWKLAKRTLITLQW